MLRYSGSLVLCPDQNPSLPNRQMGTTSHG